ASKENPPTAFVTTEKPFRRTRVPGIPRPATSATRPNTRPLQDSVVNAIVAGWGREFPARSSAPVNTRTAYWLRYAIGAAVATSRVASAAPMAYRDRKSTRLNSSHVAISYAVLRLKKKIQNRAFVTTADAWIGVNLTKIRIL